MRRAVRLNALLDISAKICYKKQGTRVCQGGLYERMKLPGSIKEGGEMAEKKNISDMRGMEHETLS